MSRLLSTASVEPAQRLAYWSDMVCDAYVQLECSAPHRGAHIEGEIVGDRLATLALSRVTSNAQTVRRTPAKIRQASEDYFLVSIQTQGQGLVMQDGRQAVLQPGDFALYDSTRPYTLQFESDFQQLVLMLPGPTLRSALRDTPRLTAQRVCGDRGAGHLMISMIQSLAQNLGTFAPASASAVADSVTQILIAGLSGLPAAEGPPRTSLAAYHLQRIKALVRERHRDAGFNVASLAQALRTSPSTLHRVWAGEACSLADWIWSLRLDSARADLSQPALAGRSISQLAFGCGFNDAAHFSRAFRARFGCTPSEYRRRAAAAPPGGTLAAATSAGPGWP